MSRRPAAILALGVLTLVALPQAHAGEAADRYVRWQGCLSRGFAVQVAMAGRNLAADAALRHCRAAERAYLDALAASPLLDAEDVARVRPALLVRARNGLVARAPNPDL